MIVNVLVPLRLHDQRLLEALGVGQGEGSVGQDELRHLLVGLRHGGGHGLGLVLFSSRHCRHQIYSIKKTLTLVTGLETFLLLFKTWTFQYELLDLFPELK